MLYTVQREAAEYYVNRVPSTEYAVRRMLAVCCMPMVKTSRLQRLIVCMQRKAIAVCSRK